MTEQDVCAIPTKLIGYKDGDISLLIRSYEQLGLKYYQPQLGAGPATVVTQAIAWLNINSFASSVVVASCVPLVKKLFGIARSWHKNHPPKEVKSLKVKRIVHFSIKTRSGDVDFDLDITKDYSVKEIGTVLDKSLSKHDK